MIPMNKWNVYIVAMIGNESFDCMRCSPKIQNTGKCWMRHRQNGIDVLDTLTDWAEKVDS